MPVSGGHGHYMFNFRVRSTRKLNIQPEPASPGLRIIIPENRGSIKQVGVNSSILIIWNKTLVNYSWNKSAMFTIHNNLLPRIICIFLHIIAYMHTGMKYRAMRRNRIALVRSVPEVISMTCIIILKDPSSNIIALVNRTLYRTIRYYMYTISVALSPWGYYNTTNMHCAYAHLHYKSINKHVATQHKLPM